MSFRDFSYGFVNEIQEYLSLYIEKLCVNVVVEDISEKPCDVFINFQLFSFEKPLSLPIRSSSKLYSRSGEIAWSEWIRFPCRYQDLPSSSEIHVSIKVSSTESGLIVNRETIIPLFNHKMLLLQGRYVCGIRSKEDVDNYDNHGYVNNQKKFLHEDRKYDNFDLSSETEWYDKLLQTKLDCLYQDEFNKGQNLYLYVLFPESNLPIFYTEATLKSSNNKNHGSNFLLPDFEMLHQNPVETKHRRLVRGHRMDPLDKDLKPNAAIRDHLNKIFRYPPTHSLSTEDSNLIWKFRYYLIREKKAFTKFIKCVDWTNPYETKQALDMIPSWQKIDPDEALELLGPDVKNSYVREFAINVLRTASDFELRLYLLQLVEAIKFEELNSKGAYESPLVEFLVHRAINNPLLGNDFHWYIMTECEEKEYSKIFAKVSYHYMTKMLECPDGFRRREIFRKQAELIEKLCIICRELRTSKESRMKKLEKLRQYLSEPKNGLSSFQEVPLPLDASIKILGIEAETAQIFKSNLMPLRLTFNTNSSEKYTLIFKLGDDLRQDQLIMQMILLMEKLLKEENLDLKLTPYRILASGIDHGMLEYVESTTLAGILAEYNGDLQSFLRLHNPDIKNSDCFGISGTVMDTYIRSCAGYCVITYILGIGDRHLDNLMLTPKGNLFHIDFGYILGRDPKPFPPPMKICREMVDAMGGASSFHFKKFKSLCYTAFVILRKSSNLISNLFALMVDGNIPDIKLDPSKAVDKILEKFRLDLSDEEAIQYFESLINDSVTALFPQLMETVHKWAQFLRT